MPGLKERAKTLVELADNCLFYFEVQPFDEKAEALRVLKNKEYVQHLAKQFENLKDFTAASIEQVIRAAATELEVKLGDLAQALRVALTGRTVSPSLFDIIAILGKEETLQRLKSF
jgi:glutamyl-tRNA synthetase